ncbi:vacuolar protein sorting-associated protein 37B-like [Astyanax mexicanus]|uniref:vacuolar protein sorting-associated protein 37B-like n=1 Tax=Astyanax mexicanus TaxID=7994 RepID=UPI0020CB03BA|nr:vacuolar protein sorting-associated protein 37B-like [Astyanax mexicanus]
MRVRSALNMPHRWDSRMNFQDHLRYLTITQLRELLEDEESIQCFISNSKKLQDLWRQNEFKWAFNRRLAERNLSYQPFLKNSKLLLAEKYQLLGRVISSIRRKHRQLGKYLLRRTSIAYSSVVLNLVPPAGQAPPLGKILNGRLSLKTTQQILKQKAVQLMVESERLWLKFLEGNLLLVDFLTLFRSSRRFYYKLQIQVEKIQDLAENLQRKEQQTARAASTLRLLSNDLLFPNAVNVFYSLSPLLMLPTTFLPLMRPEVKPSYLPPLNHHSDEGLWMPLIPVTNPSQTQELQRCWPPEPDPLKQQRETKDKRPKHSQ